MEKLTREETIIVGGEEKAACNYENNDCNDSCMYGRCKWQGKANMLLKEYEDTSLTPEQIRELKERDTARAPEPASLGEGGMVCPSCGKKALPWDRFCGECGQRFWEDE
ncbi:MAG TPA: hypothetical protein H9743_00425 [Candidatus Mediterraneibacter vanvlietii]|nr:hypothetical protein [Candidatus Mediterraneibacter vanvlietii]